MASWNRIQFTGPQGGSSAPGAIAEIERRVGARLPSDYRDFLHEVGGGYVRNPDGEAPGRYAMIAIDWQGRPQQASDPEAIVDVLFFAKDWTDRYDGGRNPALTVIGSLPGRGSNQESLFPPGLIPIGGDRGGSLFLIDIAGFRPGSVWFWASDWVDPETFAVDPYHNAALLAPTFSAFLDRIEFRE